MVLDSKPRLDLHWSCSGIELELVGESNARQDEGGKAIAAKTATPSQRSARCVAEEGG